jgi:uncharacterized protein
MELKISQLYIYPVKSMGPVAVQEAEVTDRGLKHDRRWMIVDDNYNMLSLREIPEMCMFDMEVNNNFLSLQSKNNGESIKIYTQTHSKEWVKAKIWNATVDAHTYDDKVNQWFSEQLGKKCKLVYMPDNSSRIVDTTSGYKPKGKFTSFADAYPFLLLGESSMADLNTRFPESLSILRFRPNLVFSGGQAYLEDNIAHFTINGLRFEGLENCARCAIPNVDPGTGIMNPQKEPLKTLAKYRMHNKNIIFGRNVVHSDTGIIHVGDHLLLN